VMEFHCFAREEQQSVTNAQHVKELHAQYT
jgi:hypothetical protein